MQESLAQKLLAERDGFDEDFGMVGSGFLCLYSTIDEICVQAKFVSSIDDICLFGIRPELRDIFNSRVDVCDCTVSSNKHSRLQ